MQLVVNELQYGWKEGEALGRLSFTLKPGRLLAVKGANGTGKTSLMLTLGGVLRPLSGQVKLGSLPLREGSFYLGPSLCLSPMLSAEEAALYMLNSRGLTGKTLPILLRKYGIPATRRVRELSTGQVQRLRLACAAAANLPLLLLDEPGLSLDSAGRVALRELVLTYKGMVVVASNDPEEVALAKRQLHLD